MAAFYTCRLESFSKINFDKIIGIHNDNLYCTAWYFVFAKHCGETFLQQKKKNVYIAFVDLLKVCDNVNWKVVMKILKMIIIDYRDRRIIRELYKHQTTSIKIKESKREATIRKGVRKGCNVSPLLFNIYIKKAINECEGYCTGIKVNGMRIQMLRFADNIAIIAQDEINLKRALESLDCILESNCKMKINSKKIQKL